MRETTPRGWETKALGEVSIVIASTPGQAKAATQRAAKDAGYQVTFNAIRCRRASRFDCLFDKLTPGKCYALDIADIYLATVRKPHPVST